MKYYRLIKANRAEVFIDESGEEVSAAIAMTNLHDRATGRAARPVAKKEYPVIRPVAENEHPSINLAETCQLITSSPEEAALLAQLLRPPVENTHPENFNLAETCQLITSSPEEAALLSQLIQKA